MPKVTISATETVAREYSYTVYYEPLTQVRKARKGGKVARRVKTPAYSGYQVTVPLLPGVVTYGRTLAEARAMARDAIRCHLEGLRKDGEPIPEEKQARKEKLRVAVPA